MSKSLKINRESFIYPTKEEAKKVNNKFGKINDIRISEVMEKLVLPSFNFYKIEDSLDAFFNEENIHHKRREIIRERKSNLYNKLLLTKHHLFNCLCLIERPLRRFSENEECNANAILYETSYEMFYIQFSNTIDRFYQLVDLYYNLNIAIDKISCKKISDEIANIHKEPTIINNWNEVKTSQKIISPAISIRNSFTHRISPFEDSLQWDDLKECVIDNFQYKTKANDALSNYLKLLSFLSEQAIPFLIKSPYLDVKE